MSKRAVFAFLLLLLPGFIWAQGKPEKIVTDADIHGEVLFQNDTTYVLSGFVHVEDGEELIIEAGTVVKGLPGQAENASALIVCQGGKIYAMGRQDAPIIFTAYADDTDIPDDIDVFSRGLWGGVIICGRAPINTATGIGYVEGLPVATPQDSIHARYGGDNPDDNSGILHFVSIRHAGSVLYADNEINGLTCAAVGSQTLVDYLEIFANVDDGIEFFGGDVRIKHAAIAFCGDDGFDYDEGFNGAGQFWFVIQADDIGNRCGEHDGGTDPEDGLPYAIPRISNATYIGSGALSLNTDNDYCIILRDNAGGKYYNSIFTDVFGTGVEIEDLTSGHDSRERLETGDILFSNDIWWNFGGGQVENDSWAVPYITGSATNHNYVEDPLISHISRSNAKTGLDPRANTSRTAIAVPNDTLNFFEDVDYMGAFDPNQDLWLHGWTALDAYGFLVSGSFPAHTCNDDNMPVQVVTNDDIVGNRHFVSDTVYNLSGFVYVEPGEALLIDPGTLIKSNAGQAENATALVVSRDGKLFAQGEADCPVIFTSINDDVSDPEDIDPLSRGLWGGVVLLGRDTINTAVGRGYMEGLPIASSPADSILNGYGGDETNGGADTMDCSGILNYVSIRHGGSVLFSDNEINGLTMGAIGANTLIDYVEVYGNLDDGYEWFGGHVHAKHLITAMCGDDCFDYDEGFNGRGQYWFGIMADDIGNRGGEHDGGTDPEDGLPYAIPKISNVTYIGSGALSVNTDNDHAIILRDNAGGKYYNSIYIDHFGDGVNVEDLASGHDSRERLETGDIEFAEDIWWDLGAGMVESSTWEIPYITGHPTRNNQVIDPLLKGISRTPGSMGLDPRPQSGGPADGTANWSYTSDPFFDQVTYKGAFDPNGNKASVTWMAGWTALDKYGYLGTSGCCDLAGDANDDASINVGDPVYLITHIFKNGPEPNCMNEGDANGDCSLNVGDAVTLINYVFKNGPPPVCGCVN